jgi:protein phosphatase PTC2/3
LSGPHRVHPGRLSVSRTIGDIEAKDKRYGGNPKVVVADPDIISFRIKNNYDFIVLGCDGIFEKVDNQKISSEVLKAFSCDAKPIVPSASTVPVLNSTLHSKAGDAIDRILHACINEKTLDNVTAVMIGFKNLEEMCDKGYRYPGGEDDLKMDE